MQRDALDSRKLEYGLEEKNALERRAIREGYEIQGHLTGYSRSVGAKQTTGE